MARTDTTDTDTDTDTDTHTHALPHTRTPAHPHTHTRARTNTHREREIPDEEALSRSSVPRFVPSSWAMFKFTVVHQDPHECPGHVIINVII